jgi:hypothetical protein
VICGCGLTRLSSISSLFSGTRDNNSLPLTPAPSVGRGRSHAIASHRLQSSSQAVWSGEEFARKAHEGLQVSIYDAPAAIQNEATNFSVSFATVLS